MAALYAAVDMRAPANMLTRPEPKLRDSLDARTAFAPFRGE